MISRDRDLFVAARRERWDRLEHLLLVGASGAPEWSELAALYRSLCADLARARSLALPDDVQGYLDELAGRAHNGLYGARSASGVQLVRLVASEFPRELR